MNCIKKIFGFRARCKTRIPIKTAQNHRFSWASELCNWLFVGLMVLTGCADRKNELKHWMEGSGRVKVLSTTAQIGDLVSYIGAERIDHLVLIQGDLNPHSYELVKGDDEKIRRADLIFCNGLGLEHGASLSSLLHSSPKATPLGEWISSHYSEKILKKGSVLDPHIWMDVSLWQKAIEPIVDRLSAQDPEGAPYYQERGQLLAFEMERMHLEILSLLHEVPSAKRYLITSHDAFHYFTRSYLAEDGEKEWAERFTAPEGLAPDGQLNPVDIQNILDFVQKRRVAVLFPESNVNRDSIRKIASSGKELGFEIKICPEALYGDSTSGLPYLEAMRRNGEVISRYLK